MARVMGRLPSIIKGVSQQAPFDRLEGQMGEQVNMLCDPVRGLVRRNGMLLRGTHTHPITSPTEAKLLAYKVNALSYRTHAFTFQSRHFALLYRSRARVLPGDDGPAFLAAIADYPQTFFEVREHGNMFVYQQDGISSITNVGEYLLLASNTLVPSVVTVDRWGSVENQARGVVNIVTGNYGRTYTLRWTPALGGTEKTVSYTTPSADYPGVLDISGVTPEPADTYQQRLNDVLYAYESAQNQWRVSSSEAIIPRNIAQALLDLIVVEETATAWVREGSALINTSLSGLYATDNGNGESMKFAFREVAAIDDLPGVAPVGTVMRVKPLKNSEEAYYVEAVQADRVGNMQVNWRECAGTEQTPTSVFAMGRVVFVDGADVLFIAATAETLEEMIADATGIPPDSLNGIQVPRFAASTSGDLESSPPPEFFNGPVTMMTVWQDRLIVASAGGISMSATGDYFNWYRKSLLTLADDDPILYGLRGVYGDTIRKAQVYDGHLMMFGESHHYLIDGTSVMTPMNPRIKTQYKMSGTAVANPESNGPFVFLLKEDIGNGASSRLLQIRAGVWRDSTDVSDQSMQLRDYINGTPAEVVALSSPSIVFVRTEEVPRSAGGYPGDARNRIYTYQYTDQPDGSRAQEAWSCWEWAQELGQCVGITDNPDADSLIMFTMGMHNGALVFNMLLASARTEPTGMPYIDGLTKAADWQAGPYAGVATAWTSSDAGLSFREGTPGTLLTDPWQNLGDAAPETVDPHRWVGVQGDLTTYITANPDAMNRLPNLWTGFAFPAYVDITNPFYRSRFDRSIIRGKLVLTRLRVYMSRTAGFRALVRDHAATRKAAEWFGAYRRLELHTSVAVGRDTNHCLIRLSAVDWYPLAILAIEWDGNFYNNGKTM